MSSSKVIGVAIRSLRLVNNYILEAFDVVKALFVLR